MRSDANYSNLYEKMQKEKKTLHGRNHKIKKNGGISNIKNNLELSSYNYILKNQNGVCAICHKKPTLRMLAIDHDHETGMVRGLLCFKCNTGLSLFCDDIKILKSAIKYLGLNDFIIKLNDRHSNGKWMDKTS